MRNLQITALVTNREDQSVESYFNEIEKEGLVTAQEEVILAQKIRQGDKAALDKLTKANLRFVVSVAKKYQYQGLPLCDLISEGNLGLIHAAKRFDETHGFKFISFAVWWIRQSILQAIHQHARIIRLPENKINEITQINRAAAALEQQSLREPTPAQLAEYLDVKEEKVNLALAAAPWASSLDRPCSDQDDYSLLDRLPSTAATTDHALLAESARHELAHLLSRLSPKEREIIELSYGMTGDREMSAADISPRIGLSTETVRKMRNHALQKLRASLLKTRTIA